MFYRHRSVGTRVGLSRGALAVLLALATCSRAEAPTGSADLTIRSALVVDVAELVATITGPLLDTPRRVSLARHGETWGALIGSLPAGSNYVFTAIATDQQNVVIYAGSASGISIAMGAVAAVTITLQQVDAPIAFKDAVPVIDSVVLSSTAVAPGQTITAKAVAHDPDAGDTITYAWSASPTAGGFSAPGAAATTWTAPASEGDQTLALKVSDNHGASTTASFVVHVAAANGRGQADVTATLNTWPVVEGLVAAPGYLVPGSSTSVSVTASDADGDVLSYAWSSTCVGGSFADPTSAATSFTLALGSSDTSCDLIVKVSDGRGGLTSGQATLPVGAPAVIEAPRITGSAQSTAVASAGESVNLSVDAVDPQGGALSFRWIAGVGTISNQADSAKASQILWTAPTSVVASFVVSVVVGNPAGATSQFDFFITGDCKCVGVGPGNVPVTVACGQSTCGSDYFMYACSASGWSRIDQTCDAPDSGPCECNGAGPGNLPVTVACGQSTCGSDYFMYACSASGWTRIDQTCGVPDSGP